MKSKVSIPIEFVNNPQNAQVGNFQMNEWIDVTYLFTPVTSNTLLFSDIGSCWLNDRKDAIN